uniref:Trm112 family protein n=1 Tax=Ningiella ruwaisensis TaxID=2364274 RepID=UPI00109F8641|nr:Trm112 family protein [Ningiella ruwaisensis]
MSFNKKLLNVVACPACKGKLVLHEEGETQSLVCRFDRLAYPIVDNIPVLLESEAKELSAEQLEQVKKHD